MKCLLAVMIPTSLMAASLGYSLVQGGRKLGPFLALTILLLVCGFFITFKRK